MKKIFVILIAVLFCTTSWAQGSVESAYEHYTRLAKKGDGIAMNRLGILYYNGNGVQQDYKKAFELYTKAVDMGINSKGGLSEMYYYGYYVTKDYDKAFQLAKESAEDKTTPSGKGMRILSACYRYGLGGVSIDNDKAEYWLKEAANHKNEIAMGLVGAEPGKENR